MSKEAETFESAVFVVNGKTVDAFGNEVKAEKPKAEEKPTAKPADK